MFSQAQTAPTTKSGTSSSSSKSEAADKKIEPRAVATQDQLDQFLTLVAQPAELEKDWDGFPFVEAPRSIVEHFLRRPDDLKNFDGPTGFFLFQGVKVYEEGKRREKPKDGVQP